MKALVFAVCVLVARSGVSAQPAVWQPWQDMRRCRYGLEWYLIRSRPRSRSMWRRLTQFELCATIKQRAYRRLACSTAKCGGIRPEKGGFVELPIMVARIVAHSVFISYSMTPVNLWRRRVDE
jgi:hypothetical protein